MQCVSPISINNPLTKSAADRLTVPCGRCPACLQSRRADWSFRIKQEVKDSVNARFITLTYDENNCPISDNGFRTLDKSDFQKFVKRVRKRAPKYRGKKFRYYAVGEYGQNTLRPHFHFIAFNIDPYIIDNIDNIWGNGNTDVGEVNQASIHYATKYHINKYYFKRFVDRETGLYYDVEPEFSLMSKRPAIGHGYIKRNAKWHLENGYRYVINDGFKQRMPRYYRDKIFNVPAYNKINNAKVQKEADESYRKEIARLKRLKIKEPEKYLNKALRLQAERSYDHKNNQTF